MDSQESTFFSVSKLMSSWINSWLLISRRLVKTHIKYCIHYDTNQEKTHGKKFVYLNVGQATKLTMPRIFLDFVFVSLGRDVMVKILSNFRKHFCHFCQFYLYSLIYIAIILFKKIEIDLGIIKKLIIKSKIII